jgi:hypothetical protein
LVLVQPYTCSSTEAKWVAVDDVVSKVVWTKLFIEAQNVNIKIIMLSIEIIATISSMKLKVNGKAKKAYMTLQYQVLLHQSDPMR